MATPFVPFANCAEAVCIGSMAGQAAYLTLGFQHVGPFIGTDLQNLADGMANWLVGALAPLQHAGITWSQVKVTDLTTVSSPVVVSTLGLPVNGSVGGAALTNQVAMVMSFKTALRGRSFRGRNYIPSLPPADLASTTEWANTPLTNFAAAYSTGLSANVPAVDTHVVLSRFNGGALRSIGVATPVTVYIARAAIGTQRRRIIGHGI